MKMTSVTRVCTNCCPAQAGGLEEKSRETAVYSSPADKRLSKAGQVHVFHVGVLTYT